MLGYYLNSNAKPRGSNLNEEMQTLNFMDFFISIYVDLHTLIQAYIHINKNINIHKYANIHTYTHLLTSKHTNTNTCLHTFVETSAECSAGRAI